MPWWPTYLPACLPTHHLGGRPCVFVGVGLAEAGVREIVLFSSSLSLLHPFSLRSQHNGGCEEGGRDAFYWGHPKPPSIRYLSPPALFRFV